MTLTLLVLGIFFLNAVLADLTMQAARRFPRYKILELTGFLFTFLSPISFLLIVAIFVGSKKEEKKHGKRISYSSDNSWSYWLGSSANQSNKNFVKIVELV